MPDAPVVLRIPCHPRSAVVALNRLGNFTGRGLGENRKFQRILASIGLPVAYP